MCTTNTRCQGWHLYTAHNLIISLMLLYRSDWPYRNTRMLLTSLYAWPSQHARANKTHYRWHFTTSTRLIWWLITACMYESIPSDHSSTNRVQMGSNGNHGYHMPCHYHWQLKLLECISNLDSCKSTPMLLKSSWHVHRNPPEKLSYSQMFLFIVSCANINPEFLPFSLAAL